MKKSLVGPGIVSAVAAGCRFSLMAGDLAGATVAFLLGRQVPDVPWPWFWQEEAQPELPVPKHWQMPPCEMLALRPTTQWSTDHKGVSR